eukprot:900639_1
MNLKLPIPMPQNGVVLTNDERFLIMFGSGYGIRNFSRDIYVLNLNTWIFHKSLIVMPSEFYGSCSAELMCNQIKLDLVMCHYYRKLFDMTDDIMPVDVVKLMMMWCKWNEIHVLQCNTGYHWKIDVDHILDSKINYSYV